MLQSGLMRTVVACTIFELSKDYENEKIFKTGRYKQVIHTTKQH